MPSVVYIILCTLAHSKEKYNHFESFFDFYHHRIVDTSLSNWAILFASVSEQPESSLCAESIMVMLGTSFGVLAMYILLSNYYSCQGFLGARISSHRSSILCSSSRRDVLSVLLPPTLTNLLLKDPSFALDRDDLTSQLFNPDGSLKEGVESEIKFRKVEFAWDPSEELAINQDGINTVNTKSGSKIRLFYEYPLRWSDGKDGDPIYYDRSEGTNAKACKRITVYQAPGLADGNRLEMATKIGVAKAFDAPKGDLGRLYEADIISGRVSERGSRTFYEFDMAAAPDSCGNSKENLGLGFCPYDNIYLLSATVLNDRLYCIVVECDNTKIWKLASSELKRVRSSFQVEKIV